MWVTISGGSGGTLGDIRRDMAWICIPKFCARVSREKILSVRWNDARVIFEALRKYTNLDHDFTLRQHLFQALALQQLISIVLVAGPSA
jgi:hypothetical protein